MKEKCAAYTLGESNEENKITRSTKAILTEKNDSLIMDNDNSSIVGARKKKRKTGANETPSKGTKAENVLLEHVGAMMERISSISQGLLSVAGGENDVNHLKKEGFVHIVQQEVRKSMRPTN